MGDKFLINYFRLLLNLSNYFFDAIQIFVAPG